MLKDVALAKPAHTSSPTTNTRFTVSLRTNGEVGLVRISQLPWSCAANPPLLAPPVGRKLSQTRPLPSWPISLTSLLGRPKAASKRFHDVPRVMVARQAPMGCQTPAVGALASAPAASAGTFFSAANQVV